MGEVGSIRPCHHASCSQRWRLHPNSITNEPFEVHWIGGRLKIVLSREVLSDSGHSHLESPLTVLSTDVEDSEHWWLAHGLAKDAQWAI